MSNTTAFAVFLNFAPELEFLYHSDRDASAYQEILHQVVADTQEADIFLAAADRQYEQAATEFFDGLIKPFEQSLNGLFPGCKATSKKRVSAIEGDWDWSISQDRKQWFQTGFHFHVQSGQCFATPWFWYREKECPGADLCIDGHFRRAPHDGFWYRGTYVAEPVSFDREMSMERAGKQLMHPIREVAANLLNARSRVTHGS